MQQQFIQIANLTPDQFTEAIRGALRTELAVMGIGQPTPKADPDYLTRKETAVLLRISLVTLHKLSKQGVLQSLMVNGRIRYRRTEVLAAVKEVKNEKTKR